MRLTKNLMDRFVAFGVSVDEMMDHARKTLRADRLRVLESTYQKTLATFSKGSQQLGFLIDQYERFSAEPPTPRGPATIHTLRPGTRRKKARR